MQKGVYLFPLPCILDKIYDAEFPRGLEILGVKLHKGYPKLLGLLDPEKAGKDLVRRHFRIYKSGEPFNAEGTTYVDTFVLPAPQLMLHVFEVVLPSDER